METIKEMIERMCPEGVKRVPVWSITAWDKKFNEVDAEMQTKICKYKYLLSKELDELVRPEGDVRILYTTLDEKYTTEDLAKESISEGEVVAIPWGGNACVKYYKGKFITGDNRIATSLDTNILENKFLYYWMVANVETLNRSFYRGAGIKHPSMRSVLTMEIPLPPLPIQQEIVRILDSFTQLQSNLEAELAARQKQYEYYRNKLLTFDKDDESVEWKTLGNATNISRGKRVVRKDLLEFGVIPVYQNSLKPLGYALFSNYPGGTAFIISAGAAGEVGYSSVEYWGADDCFSILCDQDTIGKYVYQWLKINEIFFQSKIRGGAIKRLSRDIVENLPIPIPSLHHQQRIVSILDTFESLITNLKQEIEARKKQYEYYREQLLTF